MFGKCFCLLKYMCGGLIRFELLCVEVQDHVCVNVFEVNNPSVTHLFTNLLSINIYLFFIY